MQRKGVILTLSIAALISLPLWLFFYNNPTALLDRPGDVATLSMEQIGANLHAWANAWLSKGDTNAAFNLPGRPILGWPTLVLTIAGISSWLIHRRYWRRAVLVLIFLAAALLPSVGSNNAPHFLRASGVILPLAILLGCGAAFLVQVIQRMFQTNVGWVIPVALILIAGRDSYKDYYSHWLSLPELYLLMEEPLVQAIDDLAITAPVGDSIYFSPLAAGHPLARYAEIRLAPRPVAAFASQDCVVTTETAAHYVSLVNFEPSFVRRLETFLPATALRNETDVATYHYQIYQTPSSASPSALATFGQALSLSRLGDLNPAYAPGETITLILGFQAKAPLDYAPSAFVHLYDQQNVPHDIVLLAQADRQLCVSYPAHLWQPDETIWQQFDLTLPDTLPAGRYLIAGGIYVFPAGPRLSIGEQLDGISDWVTLHEFETE